MNKALSIVIPVYNEEKTLKEIVEKVSAEIKDIDSEIILVDDGSKDNSRQIANDLTQKYTNVILLLNSKNLGKTQTVVKGINNSSGDIVVIQDADHEYDPVDLKKMYLDMKARDFDVLYGNRFGKKNSVVYLQNYAGNRLLSFFSNIFTYPRIHVWIPDMEVCYKMIKGNVARELAAQIKSKSNFGLEPEITARLSRYKLNGKHLKFGIHPIKYIPRTIEEGKKMHAFKDGFKALVEIIRYNC